MTPYAQAAEAHLSLGSGWTFGALIDAVVQNRGCCHITPDIFLLAKPVMAGWPEEKLCNPAEWCSGPDCWHVWLMAGDLSKALGLMPYPLPAVSFHRRGKLRVMPVGRVRRMLLRWQ